MIYIVKQQVYRILDIDCVFALIAVVALIIVTSGLKVGVSMIIVWMMLNWNFTA
jgi:hypothetical protein